MFRAASRTLLINKSIRSGRGCLNAFWAKMAQRRSMHQKSSIFGGKNSSSTPLKRCKVGVCLGKFSSMKVWFALVECGSCEIRACVVFSISFPFFNKNNALKRDKVLLTFKSKFVQLLVMGGEKRFLGMICKNHSKMRHFESLYFRLKNGNVG